MKRKLNKRGKILLTALTFMLSVLIYVLAARLGSLAAENIFCEILLIICWAWLIVGQVGSYLMIWEEE